MFLVATEPADQREIQRLLDLSDAVAASLYPGALRQSLNCATLSRPDIALYVARKVADGEESRALGCAVGEAVAYGVLHQRSALPPGQ